MRRSVCSRNYLFFPVTQGLTLLILQAVPEFFYGGHACLRYGADPFAGVEVDLHQQEADRFIAIAQRKDQKEGRMKIIVGQVDDGLDHKEHEYDLQYRSVGRISCCPVGIILRPVAHTDHSHKTEDQEHAGSDTVGFSGQAHGAQQGFTKQEKGKAGSTGNGTAKINDAFSPFEGGSVPSGTDFGSHQYGSGVGESAEEGDDDAFKCAEHSGGCNGFVHLMPQHYVDHHVADADEHFIADDGKAFFEVFSQERPAPAKMCPDFQNKGHFFYGYDHNDDQDVHHGRYKRPYSGASYAKLWQTEFTEDQGIIAQKIGHDRCDSAVQRNADLLYAAQEGTHGHGDDLQRISPPDNPQIADANLSDRNAVCIDAHDKIRMKAGEEAKYHTGDHHEGKSHPVGFTYAVLISGTPELREEEHASAYKAPIAGEHQAGILCAQADGPYGFFSKGCQHHGVDHAAGSCQKILHGHRDGDSGNHGDQVF